REVWIKLGDVRERSGRFESSLDAYRRATQLTGDNDLAKAEVLLKRARAKERAGAYSSALAETTRARAIAESIGTEDSQRLLGHILGYAALIRQAQQKPRQALDLAQRTAQVAEMAEDEIALARAWRVMDWAHFMLGEPDRAVHSVKALEVYQRVGDLDEEAGVSTNLGTISYLMGDWAAAIEHYDRGREASVRVGNLVDSAVAAANIGEVLVNQGRYEDAGEPLREARRIYSASGFSEGVAFTDLLLGRMYGIEDNLVESEQALEESIAESNALGLDAWSLEASIHLADAKCRAGSPETGLAIIAEAEASAPSDFRDYYAPLLARIRGSILNSAGQTNDAIRVLEQAITVAAERGEDYELSLLVLTLDRIAPDHTEAPSRLNAIRALRTLGVRSAPGVSLDV
ncbi:MAG: tetratricopeptide repeat protein, partial [Actinomycetota bacterium]